MATTAAAFFERFSRGSPEDALNLNLFSLVAPGLVRKEYSDESFVNDNVFIKIPAMNLNETRAVAEHFSTKLYQPEVSESFMKSMLASAVNLLHPSATEDNLARVYQTVIGNWDRDMTKPAGSAANITWTTAQLTADNPPNDLAANEPNPFFDLQDLMPEPIVVEHNEPQNRNAQQQQILNISALKEITFCAAFIMRMVTKAPDMTHAAWAKTMTNRFQKWYGRQMTMRNPGEVALRNIKNKLEDDQAMRSTWAYYVAKLDQDQNQQDPRYAINKYIGVTPISYGGMQLQNMFMQAWHKTKINPEYILKKARCPQTRVAIQEIAYISAEFEPKLQLVNPSTLFRYARVLNPQYFIGMQAKESPLMLAILVYLLSKVAVFGSTMNPEEMVAIKNMAPEMKRTAQVIASSIYEAQSRGREAEYSDITQQAFAQATAMPETEQPHHGDILL
ncbi:TPA_asm: N [Begonia betacytorhabdovirus 1]|nr:TPA_asm: N [Begonia betacytorhabdovirus 1]